MTWFDPKAALAGLRNEPYSPATIATSATSHGKNVLEDQNVAEVAEVAPHQTLTEDARDHFEERAAIREFDGGQRRNDSEHSALREAANAWGVPAHLIIHKASLQSN